MVHSFEEIMAESTGELWSGLPEHLLEDILNELLKGTPNDEVALSVRHKF